MWQTDPRQAAFRELIRLSDASALADVLRIFERGCIEAPTQEERAFNSGRAALVRDEIERRNTMRAR
jgi:hypothetical protein